MSDSEKWDSLAEELDRVRSEKEITELQVSGEAISGGEGSSLLTQEGGEWRGFGVSLDEIGTV